MPTVTIHIDAFFSVVFDYFQLIPTKVYDGTPKYSVLVIYNYILALTNVILQFYVQLIVFYF